MKKIIGGKRYDTETATLIGEAESTESRGDFNWWTAGLYVTANGNYFLAGEGGALSRFTVGLGGGSFTGGRGIEPLDESQAQEWAEMHLDPEEVEQFFGAHIVDA